jgi:SAM-dependent methyltransferase
MPFPTHDPYWCEAADLLDERLQPGETVLAPDLFWWRVHDIHRFVRANLDPGVRYDWVVVHKGEMAAIGAPFLGSVATTMTPVLANEVFVVWSARPDVAEVAAESPHLGAFRAILSELASSVDGAPTEDLPAEADRVLGSDRRLRRFSTMTDAEVRAAQDEFFRGGGYTYPTARDHAYYDELRRHEARALARWTERRVLELSCGATACEAPAKGAVLVRTDLSPVGVAMARARDGSRPGVHHATVDAHRLCFADEQFDAVMFVDAIEHVRDAQAVFHEMARVLRPGGEALVSFANSDSVNQVVARALGHSDFETNHQHMKEFSYRQIVEMLDAAGFDLRETDGIELRPYWGIPGIDDLTRDRLDEDEEFVALMLELGRRVGVEHAYVGMVAVEKR